jgi:hypothetical protein
MKCRLRRVGAALVLLVIPLSVGGLALRFKDARGPYWLGSNSDPEYAYLLNALLIAEGRVPVHIHHPGTTLQSLGAGVLCEIHRSFGGGRLREDVLKQPEAYLEAIHWTLVAACVAALSLLGAVVLRATRDWPDTLLLQAAPCLGAEALSDLSRVHPEALLMSLVPLYAATLYLCVKDEQKRYTRFAVWLGILIGLSAATKVTVLPLGLIPLGLLEGRRPKATYVAVAGASALLGTFPILSRLGRLADWLADLFLRRGAYGAGPVDVLRGKYLTSLVALLRGNPWFTIQLALGMAVVVWVWLRRGEGKEGPSDDRVRKGLTAVVLAEVILALAVARQSYLFPRYLLPATCLFGLNLVLARKLVLRRVRLGAGGRAAVAAVVLGSIAALQAASCMRELGVLEEKKLDQLATVAIAEGQFARSTKVYFFRSSSIRHALYFGDGHAGFAFSKELNRFYPDSFFYNIWVGIFCAYSGPIPLTEITSRDPRFLLQGSTRPQGAWLAFPVEPVYVGKYESLFRLSVRRRSDGLGRP